MVECPPTAGLFENGGGPLIGQSSPTCGWAFIPPDRDEVRLAEGKEHRSSAVPV